jgi:hypothetical protein
VKTEKYEYDWGIIVNFRHKMDKGKKGNDSNPLTAEPSIIVDILLHVKKSSDDEAETNVPCSPGEVSSTCSLFIYLLNTINFIVFIIIIIIIIIILLMPPLLGHRPSLWITHKENGP